MKKLLFIVLSLFVLFSFLVVTCSAGNFDDLPDLTVTPSYIGYSTQNASYYPTAWDGDDYIYVTNDNVTTNPVTFFTSFLVTPTYEQGVNYHISLAFYTLTRNTQPVIDEPIGLYSILFWNSTFTKYYTFPSENIVTYTQAYQSDDTRRIDYNITIYLSFDEKVDMQAISKCPYITTEFSNKMSNATQVRFKNQASTADCVYNTNGFQTYVSERMGEVTRHALEINDNIVLGTQKVETAIGNMPSTEYDWVNGEFGANAARPASEFFDDVVNNHLSAIVSKLSPSLQSLYDSVSSHEATFSIVVPNTKVPFFENLTILPNNVNGRIYLYDYLSPDVVAKFNEVLPIVRGFTSIGAIIGLVYWIFPKNMIGANRGD